MLQSIRDNAKGWIAYVIVGLLIIPFALFGINQYFEGGGELNAAVVNGEEVPVREVQNALLQLKQQFGGQLPEAMEESLKNTALESVISQTLLQQKIQQAGYRASDQEVADTISSIEVFQKDGRFDQETYENFLAMQNRNPGAFEYQLRGDITMQQVRGAVLSTAFLPKAEMEQYQSLRNQQRDIDTYTLAVANFNDKAQVTDEQIQAYYDQNKAAYMTEERVQLAYLELQRDKLAEGIQIDEATLNTWFEENADRYVKPEEYVASHILVEVPSPMKEAEAQQRIDALYAEIQAGTRTFEDIARTDSDDKLAAEKGGLIGSVVAGDWGPEFEKAVFALGAGEMSEPVKTEAGFEIIKVSEIKPAVQKTFAESRADVEQDYREEQAETAFLDKGETLGRVSYEQDGDLTPAAEAAGLTVQQSDWFTRISGEGIAANTKVRETAFDDEVLNSGKNSDLLELEDGRAVVVRVINHEAAAQKPLDDVKADIRQTLLAQQARELAAKRGEELLQQTQGGEGATPIGEADLSAEAALQKHGLIGRTASPLAPEVAEKAFSMSLAEGEGQIAWGGVVQANGDYILIALKAIQAGEATLEAGAEAVFQQSIGSRELGAFLQDLRDSAEIETYPENL